MKKQLTLLFALSVPAIATMAQQQIEGGSIFLNGYARVKQQGQFWFMDTQGNKAFDAATPLTGPNNGRQLVQKGQQYGIIGSDGRWLLPAAYDAIDTQWGDIWKVTKGGKQSWTDSSGRLLVPVEFEEVGFLDGNYFDVKQNGRWGIYDPATKQFVIAATYEGFDYCGGCGLKGNYVMAKKNGKWGIIDFSGKELVPFEYDHEHFGMRSDNWITAFTRNKKRVVLNLGTGKEYPEGEVLNNGLLVYQLKGKSGMINYACTEVLPPVYDDISSPDPQFAITTEYVSLQQNGVWGLADTAGNIRIKPAYDEFFTTVFDSLFLTKQKGLEVLLNASGKNLLPNGCTDVEVIKDAAAVAFRVNGKYGVLFVETGHITEAKYAEVNEQYYGTPWLKSCVKIVKDGWTGLLAPDGNEVVPPQFEDDFTTPGAGEGFVVVRKGDQRGLYNSLGREVAPVIYYSISRDAENGKYFRVSKEKESAFAIGIIDTAGNIVVPVEHDEITILESPLAIITKEEVCKVVNIATGEVIALPNATGASPVSPGIINVYTPSGNYLFDLQKRKATPVYDLIGNIKGGAAMVKREGKRGLLRTDGKVLLPLEYDLGSDLKNGVALFGKGSKYGFADSSGVIIVPVQYDFDMDAYDPEHRRGNFLLLRRKDENYKALFGVAGLRGNVIAEPAYEAILTDEENKAFIVMKKGKMGVLAADGRLVAPCEFDDVYPATMNRFTGTFTFSWPMLCRKGDNYVYYGSDGKPLPVASKEMLPYTDSIW